MRRLRLATYGNSLYVSSIAASLAREMRVEVSLVDPDSPAARHSLEDLAPDVIVLELDPATLELPLALLLERPGLLLVVLSPCCDDLLVLSGHRSQSTTAIDLVRVLTEALGVPA